MMPFISGGCFMFSARFIGVLFDSKKKALGALKLPRLFRATINMRLAGDGPNYGNTLAGSARARGAHKKDDVV